MIANTFYTRLLPIVTLLIAQLASVSQLTADVALPTLSKGKGEQCVAPVETMRRDHMKILFAQRDKTVIHGVRDQRHSLTRCISCHVQSDQQGKPTPVNAPGQFCEACHAYTGVKMDCFECHRAVPDQVKTPLSGQIAQYGAASTWTVLKGGASPP